MNFLLVCVFASLWILPIFSFENIVFAIAADTKSDVYQSFIEIEEYRRRLQVECGKIFRVFAGRIWYENYCFPKKYNGDRDRRRALAWIGSGNTNSAKPTKAIDRTSVSERGGLGGATGAIFRNVAVPHC